MTEKNKTIGRKIKKLRKQAGLTQEKLAEYLGVDRSFISKAEKGERALTSVMLDRLATLFGVEVTALYDPFCDIKPLNTALCAKELTAEDLQVLADIHRIAINCNFMTKLLNLNEKNIVLQLPQGGAHGEHI